MARGGQCDDCNARARSTVIHYVQQTPEQAADWALKQQMRATQQTETTEAMEQAYRAHHVRLARLSRAHFKRLAGRFSTGELAVRRSALSTSH